MAELIDLLLHVDVYLIELIATYGGWIYAILFLIVFAETGLVVTPFLPGDSLLFATGALAASGALDVRVVLLLVAIAAIAGDAVNYAVGRLIGVRVIRLSRTDPRWRRWINPIYMDRAHEFFERHGGKAIVIARFAPFLRTFVPFVAGVGRMPYGYFLACNLLGALAWVGAFVGLGYFFGNLPGVKRHFTWVLLGIILVSLLPAVVAWLRARQGSRG